MGTAVVESGNAGVGTDDIDGIASIGHRQEELVEAAAGGEGTKGVNKGSLAGGRHTCCHTDHIALCDSAVNEPLWIGFLEDSCLSRCCKVCIQYNDLRMLRSKLG